MRLLLRKDMDLSPKAIEEIVCSASKAVRNHEVWRGELKAGLASSITPDSVMASIKMYWHSLTPHTLRLTRNGKIHPKTRLSIHRSDFRLVDHFDYSEFYQLYSDGYTIIYRQLASRHPSFSLLAHAVSESFLAWPTINLYLSPRHQQGFGEHADHHDVLVLQCSGTKGWTLMREPQNPEELTLEVGSMLYLPEGVRHFARSDDQPSVHITIGFRPPSIDQFFAWLGDRLREPGGSASYIDVARDSPPEQLGEILSEHWKQYLIESRRGHGRASLEPKRKTSKP